MNNAISPINAERTGAQPFKNAIISVPHPKQDGRAETTVNAIKSKPIIIEIMITLQKTMFQKRKCTAPEKHW